MIVKKIASKGAGASFGGLADYLLDKLNLHKDKVENIEFSNCEFDDINTNIEFIEQMQELNDTKSDKTLHLIVSFQEDEKPTKAMLVDIEKELLKSIGMEYHHRLSATHANTNNYHLHIAVNRIDPNTHKRIDPFQDLPKLHKKAIELEEKHKLGLDNHIPNWILAEPKLNQKSQDIKAYTGISNLMDWIKDQVLDDLKAVLSDKNSSLEQLHTTLAKYNLELKERGNGLVIKDKSRNLFCKVSDIHRDLSKGKLSQKYGEFKPMQIDIKPTTQFGTPKTKLWEKYLGEMESRKAAKQKEFSKLKVNYLKDTAGIKAKWNGGRNQLKSNSKMNKKIKREAYQTIFANQRAELEELREAYNSKKSHIYKENKHQSYNEYLISEALKGNTEALAALRKSTPKLKKDDNTIGNKIDHKLYISYKPLITKLGYVIYKLDDKNDNSKIIDKGNHLKISNASDEALLKALEMARVKYGKELDINGDINFKTKVISLAQKHNLDINFKDKTMQEILKPAIIVKPKEKQQDNKQTKQQGVER